MIMDEEFNSVSLLSDYCRGNNFELNIDSWDSAEWIDLYKLAVCKCLSFVVLFFVCFENFLLAAIRGIARSIFDLFLLFFIFFPFILCCYLKMCIANLRKCLHPLHLFDLQIHFIIRDFNCSYYNFNNLHHLNNCHLEFQSLSFYSISKPNFIFYSWNHFPTDWNEYHNFQQDH
jgi:hypothetical protein